VSPNQPGPLLTVRAALILLLAGLSGVAAAYLTVLGGGRLPCAVPKLVHRSRPGLWHQLARYAVLADQTKQVSDHDKVIGTHTTAS
jgi:hypothetical protein